MGFFVGLGYAITKCPALCALLLPVTAIIFVSIGFGNYKVADDVGSIWVPETTSYAANEKYRRSIVGGSTSTSFLAISKPRQGGNVMRAELLLELRDHLNRTQSTKVSVDGMTFGLQDICVNPAGAYMFPCLRMTALDCFAEGGYDFTDQAANAWRVLAKGKTKDAIRPQAMAAAEAQAAAAKPAAMQASLAETVTIIYDSAVSSFLAQNETGACADSCKFDGPAAAIAAALGQPSGSWENDPVCGTCLTTSASKMTAVDKDAAYAGTLRLIVLSMGFTVASLKARYNVSTEKAAMDMLIPDLPQVIAMVEANVDAYFQDLMAATLDLQLDEQVNALLSGQTPYTFKTFSPLGSRRQDLKDPVTGHLATDSEVLAAASSTCYAWDGGAVLPSNLNVLLYGKPVPSDFEANINLTSMEALHHLYSLMVPEGIQARVATRPAEYGGPAVLTLKQAEEVLLKFKQAFEESFSAGWDDAEKGKLEHTAFTDDAGAAGSFARTLSEVTTDSVPLIAIYGGLTVLISALFFVTTDCVASRTVLVVLGSMFAILGCFAALGLSAMLGIDLNVVHFWTMPFVIIGIGIDDMFMLTLSTKTVDMPDGIQACFVRAFAQIALPITMTSLVNGAMFAIMSLVSDIPAVYQAGYTGLMASAILYFTMLLSFSALIFMDAQRRSARRYECLPCLKAPVASVVVSSAKPGLGQVVYNRAYKPLIIHWPLRVFVLLVATAILVVASVGLRDVPVGLDLNDFFPEGSQAGKFSANRKDYFPVWPVTLNWGAIEYTNPQVQLKMAKQWESMLDTNHIAGHGLQTTMVWTAALAEWGLNNNATCKSTFKNNTLGLKLKSEGGFCLPTAHGSKCPVLEGLTEQDMAQCIAKWKASSLNYKVIGPQIPLTADGTTPLTPIRYSSASGSVLFGANLWSTAEYTNLIKQTRAVIDDDESIHSWMSGIPYDFWEQYLTIVDVMSLIGGLSIAVGFVISIVFLWVELSSSKRGTSLQRFCGCFVASFLIALVSGVSLVVVVGFCALMDIKLSGFTAMSCVMSTGLAVEYSVHVVHRFLEAPRGSAAARVDHAMGWLFSPSGMAFVTSAFSVIMMAFSEFRFVRLYFFAPLACAVLTSYFFGAFALSCLLGFMDCLPGLSTSSEGEDHATKAGDCTDVENCTDAEKPESSLSNSAIRADIVEA